MAGEDSGDVGADTGAVGADTGAVGADTGAAGTDAGDDDNRALEIFFEVHTDLPREGPGNRASTARALEMVGRLPERPRVLDVGCGPGMQTADLADLLPGAVITAVDAHRPFVEAAQQRIQDAGFGDRVTVVEGDMRALAYPAASFDLIWCEGAAYIMGVTDALTAWHPLLRTGGRLALTDAVWLNNEPPTDLLSWWLKGYPEMGDVDDRLESVNDAGFGVLDHFVLPEDAWWDHYYTPMEQRLADMRTRHGADPQALTTIDACQLEIDYYRRWPEHYGYLFVVAEKAAQPGADGGAG